MACSLTYVVDPGRESSVFSGNIDYEEEQLKNCYISSLVSIETVLKPIHNPSGFVKQKVYNPKTGMDSLMVTPVSQAGAK